MGGRGNLQGFIWGGVGDQGMFPPHTGIDGYSHL